MDNIYDDSSFFESYAKMPRSQYGLKAAGEWHQLEPLFPNIEGKKVLDLGCGYGWLSKYSVDIGASEVLGIDISANMIDKAKKENPHSFITYKVCNLDEFDYPNEYYDLVISNLVLHYIENLENIYQKIYKTLKSHGIFLFNIEHPVFTSGVNEDWIYDEEKRPLYWPVDNYYYPGERDTLFLDHHVIKYHHTLTGILNPLIMSGFQIEAVEEVMPNKEMLSIPGMKDEMRRPMMLIVKAKKK